MVCRSRVQPSLFGEELRSDTKERRKSSLLRMQTYFPLSLVSAETREPKIRLLSQAKKVITLVFVLSRQQTPPAWRCTCKVSCKQYLTSPDILDIITPYWNVVFCLPCRLFFLPWAPYLDPPLLIYYHILPTHIKTIASHSVGRIDNFFGPFCFPFFQGHGMIVERYPS